MTKEEIEKFYININRLDILCAHSMDMPINPCEKCKSEKCDGKGKCKGFGSYVLGIRL